MSTTSAGYAADLQTRPTHGLILQLILTFIGYLLTGEIGLAVPFTSANVSPVWPAAGVALAAMLICGKQVWPAVALGAFVVNYSSGLPFPAALGIAAGNTLGALCGAFLLLRMPRFQPALTRLRDVLNLSILGALCGSAVSATAGNLALHLAGIHAWFGPGSGWLMWWFGDAIGILLITPLVLTASSLMRIRGKRRLIELSCLVIGAAGSTLVIFSPRLGFMRPDVFAFIVFPFVLWGAIRFQSGGAAIVSLFVSAITVWRTAHGVGPFVQSDALHSAMLLQAFLFVIAITGITLAAVIAERTELERKQSATEALNQSEKEYRSIVQSANEGISLLSQVVEQTADSVVITDCKGIIEYVNPAFEKTTGYSRAEAVGKTPRIISSGIHQKEFYSSMWDRILVGEPFRGTLVNRKKSCGLYWTEQTITPIKDSAGNTGHFVSVHKDITEFRKLTEQELQLGLAREVQQRFYDNAAINVRGLDIASVACPAEQTGGDYVDMFTIPDGRICIGIGDVSGHGLGSALVMALTRAYVRSFAQVERDLASILKKVNLMLFADLGNDRYVTLLLVLLDRAANLLTYASAGHVPGFLISSSGEVDHVLESSGPPLGLFGNSHYVDEVVPLAPEKLLVLVTDGAAESTASLDGLEFGNDGILAYVHDHRKDKARDLAKGICDAARQFRGGYPQQDDVTDVVVKVA